MVVRQEVANLTNQRISHILAPKHDWNRVVPVPVNWGEVSVLMSEVLDEGTEGPYSRVFFKILVVAGQTVEVTYAKLASGIKISDAWVRDC
nr:polymorphic toxin type 35 domain-containing protein [Listeria grandensis]